MRWSMVAICHQTLSMHKRGPQRQVCEAVLRLDNGEHAVRNRVWGVLENWAAWQRGLALRHGDKQQFLAAIDRLLGGGVSRKLRLHALVDMMYRLLGSHGERWIERGTHYTLHLVQNQPNAVLSDYRIWRVASSSYNWYFYNI